MSVPKSVQMSAPARSLLQTLSLSFAEKYTVLVLGMVSSVVVARLLTPAQIGVFSVGAVVVGFAQLARDFGVGQYLIQEPELNADQLRAAFTLTLLIAWAVALLLVLAAPAVAQFYRDAGVGSVLRILAMNCLLIPFGSVTLPCLRRQMRFGALYCINVVSAAVNLLACLVLAYAGLGYLGLAWAAVAGTAASVLASLCFRPRGMPWRPGWRGLRRLLSFGAYASAANLLDEAGVAAPDLVIGKLIDMAGVGLFSKAQGLLNLFNQLITRAVTPVLLPLYAAQVREGRDMKPAYLQTISFMAVLSWPFYGVLAVLAWPAVRLLYGAQWDAVVPLVRCLCLGAAVFSLFGMARDLFVAMGQVRQRARLEAISVPLRVLGIALAAPFGLIAVACAIVLTSCLKCLLIYRTLAALTGMRVAELAAALWRAAGVTVLALAAPLAAMQALPVADGHGLAPLLAGGVGAGVGWIAGVFLLRHEIAPHLARALGQLWRPWRARAFKP